MTNDKITNRLEARNKRLSEIAEGLERNHRKLTRIVNAIDKLRTERKRLLRPQPLDKIDPKLKIDSGDWHKIGEMEFSDDLATL